MKLAYKLGIGIGIVTFLLVIISTIGIVNLNMGADGFLHSMERTEEASNAVDIETEFLQVRRGEKDFLARKDLKYFERANEHLDKAEEIVAELLSSVEEGEVKNELEEIAISIENYDTYFHHLRDDLVTRGLTHEDGVQKKFRSAAQQVQNSSTGAIKSTVLTLRKHEKDYMLRKDPKYITRAKNTLDELRGSVSDQILNDYWTNFEALVALDNKVVEHLGVMKTNADLAMDSSDKIHTMVSKVAHDNAEEIVAQSRKAVTIFVVLSVIAIVMAIVTGVYLVRIITKPIKRVVEVANSIADGDFSQSVDHIQNDEIGQLGTSINDMNQSLKANSLEMQSNIDMGAAVVEEVKNVARIVGTEGDIEYRPNVEIGTGAYREMLEEFSVFIDGFVGDMLEVINGASSYAEGNFDFVAKNLPGKKIVLTDAFNKLRENLLLLVSEGVGLAESAKKGDLEKRADVEKFQGGYRDIINGMNDTIENILSPIAESVKSLEAMSDGNLTVDVSGKYKGDHAVIKNAINGSLDSLNSLLSQVNTTSDQVSSGAQQVSDSSQSLSQGATEQASSLEEISASMSEIGSQTKVNAENAKEASNIANDARTAADAGNEQMQTMLDSMNGINDSSREISRIIKVIDEIAFQTNLLALNAAVEAARAGVHGKGFAVVAEEVRNLAQRSAAAASETTELIEGSNKRVESGVQIANGTAEALSEIVTSIAKVNDLIGEIAEASKEQSVSNDQISSALMQVDSVTQSNTANAEESASAAEELSGQSHYLKQMLTKFVLKDDGSNSAQGVMLSSSSLHNSSEIQSFPKHQARDDKGSLVSEVNPENLISLDDEDFLNF